MDEMAAGYAEVGAGDRTHRRGKGGGKSKGAKGGTRWRPKFPQPTIAANTQGRPSLFTTGSFTGLSCEDRMKSVGGRICALDTGEALLGEVECIVIEPQGKQLAPQDYNTTGVVICFDGMAPSSSTLCEWCAATEAVGWLDLGVTVVLPNVQMSAALQLSDLEAVVKASLRAASFESCLLVGKGWGAERVVGLAIGGGVADVIEGVMVIAPSSEPPLNCADLEIPALLLWSKDDDLVSFSQSEAWVEALDNRCAPTTFKDVETGGHQVDKMLHSAGVAQAARDFTVATFLLADLDEVADEKSLDLTPVSRSNSQRFSRLSLELPSFLRECGERVETPTTGTPDVGSTAPAEPALTPAQKTMQRLTVELPHWIQAGLTSASE